MFRSKTNKTPLAYAKFSKEKMKDNFMQSEAGLENSFQSSIYDCVIDGMGAEHHAYLKQLLEQKNKAKGKHFQARSSANVLQDHILCGNSEIGTGNRRSQPNRRYLEKHCFGNGVLNESFTEEGKIIGEKEQREVYEMKARKNQNNQNRFIYNGPRIQRATCETTKSVSKITSPVSTPKAGHNRERRIPKNKLGFLQYLDNYIGALTEEVNESMNESDTGHTQQMKATLTWSKPKTKELQKTSCLIKSLKQQNLLLKSDLQKSQHNEQAMRQVIYRMTQQLSKYNARLLKEQSEKQELQYQMKELESNILKCIPDRQQRLQTMLDDQKQTIYTNPKISRKQLQQQRGRKQRQSHKVGKQTMFYSTIQE